MSNLTKEQAIHCANVFSNYFDRFERIDDYIRDQKLNSLSDRPPGLPGMGPEDDLFSDFDMNPNDIDFEICDIPNKQWNILNSITSSALNPESPGRNIKLAIKEKNTNKFKLKT